MFLGHRRFRSVENVAGEFAEEREARAEAVEHFDTLFVRHIKRLRRIALPREIHILADFHIPLRAENESSAVAPDGKAVGREPVHAEVERRAVCTVDGAVAEVVQLRVLRMRVVGNAAAGDCAVLLARIEQVLLDLVAAASTAPSTCSRSP